MDGVGMTRRRLRHNQTVARYRKPFNVGIDSPEHEARSDKHAPDGFTPWKKVLYERQPYADNYVDNSFLSQLKIDASEQRDSFLNTILSTFVVTQQLSVTVIFLGTFKYLAAGLLPVLEVLIFDLWVLGVVCCVHAVLDPSFPGIDHSLRSFFLFVVCLRIVTPVLQTLTSSYSSDTIFALTLLLSSVHLTFHDYAYVNSQTIRFSGTISLNAAMFTTVLLASRLLTTAEVFVLALLSVEVFALFPETVRLVKAKSVAAHVGITLGLWAFATVELLLLDKTLLACYQALVLCISVVSPAWMRLLHKYKSVLHGPWDIPPLDSHVDAYD